MQNDNRNILQKKRQQLEYRRRIAIVDADLRKMKRERQTHAINLRRLKTKRDQIDAQIRDVEREIEKLDGTIRLLANELKTQKKRLDRIS